jgi:hypothetical protein
MSTKSPFLVPAVFSLLVLAGLVGMLVTDGPLDALFLGAAASPLLIGGIAWTFARRKHR